MSQSQEKKSQKKKDYKFYLATLPPQYWREVLIKPIKKRGCNSNIRYVGKIY